MIGQSDDGPHHIGIFDRRGRRELRRCEVAVRPIALAVTPDGLYVATSDEISGT